MAILGYNTAGANCDGMSTGRLLCSKATLAADASLNELHGYFNDGGSPVSTVRLVIYKGITLGNISGATLVAYSNPILLNGGATTHAQQAGFSVPLPAGEYWIGARSDVAGGFWRGTTGSGSYSGVDTGASDPPPATISTVTASGTELLSCWAVTGAALAPVADFTGTPLVGTAPLTVAFTNLSTG